MKELIKQKSLGDLYFFCQKLKFKEYPYNEDITPLTKFSRRKDVILIPNFQNIISIRTIKNTLNLKIYISPSKRNYWIIKKA